MRLRSAVTPAVAALVLSFLSGFAGTAQASVVPVTKVLIFVEENHSLAQMQSGMPYAYSLAQQYGYATHYQAITHPSLPNYLAIAAGSTFGIADDNPPSAHPLSGSTVFGQAWAAGRTAKTYAQSMSANCQLTSSGNYAVKHNPWTYFTATYERSHCKTYDVPGGNFPGEIGRAHV